tara:strand:+ start:682 stop:834 length:153 start_codon:yes stop_codon:yes gene_type:complete
MGERQVIISTNLFEWISIPDLIHIVDSPSNSYHKDSTASNTFREEELDWW